MNTLRPHQRSAAHRRSDAMDTYTVRLPRWPILLRLLGPDPLVHTTGRIQTVLAALSVVLTLLTAPVAAGIGAEVYDARRHVYAEQVLAESSNSRAAVEAVVVALAVWAGFAIWATALLTLLWAGLRRISAAFGRFPRERCRITTTNRPVVVRLRQTAP